MGEKPLPLLVLPSLPISLPGVLQCFSLLCIMGLLALILLLTKLSASSQSFSQGWSHSHPSCWALLSFSWYRKTVTQATRPEDLTLPSLLDSAYKYNIPWWQKYNIQNSLMAKIFIGIHIHARWQRNFPHANLLVSQCLHLLRACCDGSQS